MIAAALPESCDIFFRKGVEGRILFRTGPDGKTDALIDRRNNEDVVWRKLATNAKSQTPAAVRNPQSANLS